VVQPAAPAVTQAACIGGSVTQPTLTPALTDGITYTADPAGPYAAGQTVTVTATLDDGGVGWPSTMPPGWTAVSDTVATYTVVFDDASCHAVTPVAPTATHPECVGDSATAPTITLPVTSGLVYAADPPGPYGLTGVQVTVTATLVEGFAWAANGTAGLRGVAPADALPAGWTLINPTQATFAVTLNRAPDCLILALEGGPTAPEQGPAPAEPPAPSEPSAPAPGEPSAPSEPSAPGEPGAPGSDLAHTGSTRALGGELMVAAGAIGVGTLMVRIGGRRRRPLRRT
jgi:hypothetical protein